MSRTAIAIKSQSVGLGLFDEIRDMLEAGGLEPTTANYDLCYRHVTGSDRELSGHVSVAIGRFGALTPEAIATMSDVVPKATPRQLAKLAEDTSKQMAKLIDLAASSGQNATEYGAALESADFDTDPAKMVASLVSITKTMARKTEALEAEMRKVSEEAQTLRGDLAEARERAASDPLTGLANRRAFDAALKEAVEDSRTNKTPLAVAIVDIDHFKHINDNFGHDVGDRVIKYIANLLQTTQGAPFVGRYGGEEFVLIFKGLDTKAACMRLEEIREKMHATTLRVEDSGQPIGRVTFSAGIAGPPLRTTATSILKSADIALYRAKHQGRNQIEIAGAAE